MSKHGSITTSFSTNDTLKTFALKPTDTRSHIPTVSRYRQTRLWRRMPFSTDPANRDDSISYLDALHKGKAPVPI